MKGERKTTAVAASATEGAPDGGWGWVIAAGSLVNVALLIGVARCSGLLYATLPTHFGISRSLAASLAAVNGVVLCLVGPISGALLNRFSCRQITIACGFISCGGIIVASFAKSPAVFVVGFGLIAGTGSGLFLVPSKMIITQYFVKRRPLVLGLVMSGSCVGGITIPPLMEILIEKYGLEGALLVISAMMLHFIPVGMTFIPLQTREEESKMAAQSTTSVETISSIVYAKTEDEIKSESCTPAKINNISASNLERQAIKKADDSRWKAATNDFHRTAVLGDGVVASWKAPTAKLRMAKAFAKAMKASNLSIFSDVHFLLISLTACCPLLGFTAMGLTLPEYAREQSIEPVSPIQAAFLLSILSLGDVVGRVFMSWFISTGICRTKYSFVASSVGSALALLCFPFVHVYTWLAGLTAVYGVFTGAVNIMPVLLVNEYLPHPKLAAAYGCLLLVLAMPIMIVSPLMGQVRDATGGYAVSYWVVSAVVASGTLPWIAEISLECRTKRKTFWLENSSVL